MKLRTVPQKSMIVHWNEKVGGAAAIPWYLTGGIAAVNCIAVYQPKGAASLAASYINLITPGTLDAALGVAPTFNTATGWTFDGTSQYLKTGVVPAANQGGTVIINFNAAAVSGNPFFGVYESATNRLRAYPRHTGGSRFYQHNSSTSFVGTLTSGVIAIAGVQPYLNGSAEASALAVQTATPTTEMYIGGYNNGGVAEGLAGSTITQFVYYDTVLNPTQVAAVSDAMAAL
jgi:hypothetical protein